MVQKSSSSNNIQGGQLEVAPELTPHRGPKDRMAEDASLAEDAETCGWRKMLRVICLYVQVPRNLWTLECSASPAEIHQPQTHPKGDGKMTKTKPGRSEWSEVMVCFSTMPTHFNPSRGTKMTFNQYFLCSAVMK